MTVIVAVDKRDALPLSNVKPRVSRGGKSAVLLMDDFNSTVERRVIVAYLTATIRGAVVDEDQFEILISLGKNAVDAAAEIILNIIDGNNNADHSLDLPPL